MFIKGNFAEKNAILNTAEKMCAAIRTAPKAKGIDHIVTAVLTAEDKDKLATKMLQISEDMGLPHFLRDSKSILASEAVVLVGSASGPRGIANCGLCGFSTCAESANNGSLCTYDDIDLGIALGSAASIASLDRIDNRIMFTAGKAAMDLGVLGENVYRIFAIPLSATGKSIFFDR